VRDDLEGMSPEEPIKWYLARDGQQYGPLSDAEMRKFRDLAIWCQAIWSGAKGLRTGCPLILFSISQSRHRVRAKVSVGRSGKPLPRPYRWVSACDDMTIGVGPSGEPATFMMRTTAANVATLNPPQWQ
jgi:hypothetical protein